MPTIRELEDLIIDAIYQDVIRGKLDQKEQQFEVEYTMGRDLEPGKIENVLSALQAWFGFRYALSLQNLTHETIRANTTSSVLSTLDKKLASLASQASQKHKQEEDYEKELAATIKHVQDKQKDSRSAGPKNATSKLNIPTRLEKDKDGMDVDEPVEGKGKNKK